MLLTSKTRDPAIPLAGPVSRGALRPWPTAAIANIILASLVVSVSASHADASLLPYIPTTVLIPKSSTRDTNRTAYIFTPNSAGDNVDLVSLDISSALAAASISSAAQTLTSGVPFLSSNSNTTTFTPTIAADGSILVYAGDCTSESGSGVWTYNTTSSSRASWGQYQVTDNGASSPYFLGEAMAFSEVIAPSFSAPQIYSYGGQCPNASVNGTTWVNTADYTNAMVKLTLSSDGYEAQTISLKSQPIAEAGFSLTQLLPSTSNISGTVTQSVNSVVLGGHTQFAFVNMSTAAVWSLPEESWSFISISGPSRSSLASDTSELAKNGETGQVQSRSGHTAILNEAGTSLIVLGGWVGNTSQAAEPQLAVLEMNGSEFGEWTWSVPDNQPLADGEGIYGHGAALLPGNVMMIMGGYSLSSSSASSPSSRLGRRDNLGVAGGQLKMFLNLTSMSWADSYTNPLTTSSGSGHTAASSSTTSTRLALGLGLGLGIPLFLILLAIAFFCVRRSQHNRHSNRDDHVRGLTSGATFITSDEMLEAEHEHEYPWGPAAAGAARWYSYTGGHDPYLRDEKSLGYESLRGQRGVRHPDFGDAAAEPPGGGGYRGPARRKPAPRVAKGLYQPTGVDDSRSLGVISPILEDEEDELSMHGAISPDRDMEGGNEDDPFVTPSHPTPEPMRGVPPGPSERSTILFVAPSPSPDPPPSPTDERTRTHTRTPTLILPQHPEVQDWVTDIDASDALITRRIQPHSTTMPVRNLGRLSPIRRTSIRVNDDDLSPGDRTDSNLSESTRSAFSFLPNRSESLRVAAVGVGLLGVVNPERRGGTSHSDNSSSSNNTNSSYTTAKSIPTLQQEGPTLLLGRPRAISVIEDLANVSDDDHHPLSPGSPSKNKAPRRSWFGSLRRVFSGGHSSGSSAGTSIRGESPTHGETSDYDRLGLNSLGLGGVGLLQKRRQGRSAWDDHGGGASGSGGQDHSHGHGHGAGEGWDEEDWDIERAVEQRLVQVMFSVPKERLRIVNGEPDIISIEESVVVVDPEKDGDDDEAGELSPILEEEKMILGKGKDKAEGKQAGADDELPKTSDSVKQRGDDEAGAETRDKGKAMQPEGQRQPLLLEVPQHADSEASESPRRSFSPGVPMTAEEVRFERPRTRVLDMVENIEERSRSSSPAKEEASFLKD